METFKSIWFNYSSKFSSHLIAQALYSYNLELIVL